MDTLKDTLNGNTLQVVNDGETVIFRIKKGKHNQGIAKLDRDSAAKIGAALVAFGAGGD